MYSRSDVFLCVLINVSVFMLQKGPGQRFHCGDFFLLMYTHTHIHSKTSKKSEKKQTTHTTVLTPDHTHLTCGHHQAIIATLALLPNLLTQSTRTQSTAAPSSQSETEERGGGACKSEIGGTGTCSVVVGLGGGALPMFINKCIPNVSCCGFVHTHMHTRAHLYF